VITTLCVVAVATALSSAVYGLATLLFVAEILAVVFVPRAALALLFGLLIMQEAIARNVGAFDSALPGLVRSIDEILMVATLVRVGVLAVRREVVWLSPKLWRWPMVFVGAGLSSSLLHWRGPIVAILGMALASKFLIYLLLGLSIPWKREDAERALDWCIPLTVIILATGLLGFLSPAIYAKYFASVEGDVSYERGGVMPFALPFVQPGLYGWLMAVLLLGAVTLAIEKRRIGAQLTIVGAAIGVLASLRRRPLLGIPMAIGSALTQLSRRQIAAITIAAGIAAGTLAFYARDLVNIVVEDTLASYLDPLSRDRTARAALIAGGVTLAVRQFPLGEGFGTYGGYVSQRNYSPLYDELGLSTVYGLAPESPDYLQDTYWPHLLGETGVIGTAAMLFFLVATWRRLLVIRSKSTSPQLRMIALFAVMILVEGAVESLAGPVFEYSLQAFVLAVPIAMALRLARDEAVEEPVA
jgi:hypothetical protein